MRSMRHMQDELQPLTWDEIPVAGPDVEKRETLLQLAKMTYDAYYEPGDKDWYDLGPDWNTVRCPWWSLRECIQILKLFLLFYRLIRLAGSQMRMDFAVTSLACSLPMMSEESYSNPSARFQCPRIMPRLWYPSKALPGPGSQAVEDRPPRKIN